MGGAEPTLYRGSVWYTPIVEEWYYQVEVLKLEVDDQNLNLDCKEVNGFMFKPDNIMMKVVTQCNGSLYESVLMGRVCRG